MHSDKKKSGGGRSQVDTDTAAEPSWQSVMVCDIKPQLKANAGVKGLYLHNTVVGILAQPNVGKSFLGLDLLAHHAMGKPWRGRAVHKGAALAILCEGGRAAQNRICAQVKSGLLTTNAPLQLLIGSFDLCHDDVHAWKIIALAQQLARNTGEPISVILIDTLAMTFAGGDENGPEMGAVIANLRLICDETGATVLVIHHLGKDASKGARGHSSFWGAMDTELVITGHDKRRTLAIKKQRDMEYIEVMPFELEVVQLGIDEDGDPVTSCVVKHVESGGAPKSQRKLIQRSVVDAVAQWARANPDAVGLNRNQVRELLDPLGYEGKDRRKIIVRELKALGVLERYGALYKVNRAALSALEGGASGEGGR